MDGSAWEGGSDVHDVAIALVVKAVGSTGSETGTLVALVIRLGTVFGDDNPAYRHDLFIEACGLDHLADVCAT